MPSEIPRRRIAVVGGGIAGLAAAHRLVELSRERGIEIELRLFEAAARPGGSISSERTGGFVIESGPDSFISEKPWALQLCERLGLTPRLVRTRDEHRRTYIVHGGRLHELPDGFLLLAPTRFWPLVTTPLFTWPGKLRMGLDLLLPRGPERADESLGSFVTRRLGREALERVAQPLVGGIYTADPDDLSLAATMPRFLEMERRERSVILAMWRQMRRAPAAARAGSGARWSLFVSIDDGMQTLVDALAQRLPEGVLRCGVGVDAIRGALTESGSLPGPPPLHDSLRSPLAGERTASIGAANPLPRAGGEGPRREPQTPSDRARWQLALSDGTTWQADALVLATPAHRSADLLRGIDAALVAELEGIPYASSATVSLAYPESAFPRPLDGFGFVVPFIERRAIVACTYSSIKYPGRAPAGHVLLRCFVGGALQRERFEEDDATMVERARRELAELLGVQSAPLFTRVHRHPRAMPQYRVGHLERMAHIEARLAAIGDLALCGNAYRGVGIPDCVRSGELAAEAVLGAAQRET